MALVYVYDSKNEDWIVKDAGMDEPMPGSIRGSVTIGEFLGPCRTDMLWSDLRALRALQKLQDCAGSVDVRVRYAFRRLAEGAHKGQSAHCAGLAFDIGKKLTTKEQLRLMGIALDRCGFERVEPPYSTPGWLHVEKRIAPPASALGEYPILQQNSKGVHVLLLQDALNLHGIQTGLLTGNFTTQTAGILRHFQQQKGLAITGIADGATWHVLMQRPKNRVAVQRLL